MSAVSGMPRSCVSICRPDITGIITSETIRSGRSLMARWQPSSPLLASSTWYSARSTLVTKPRISASSSTTRTRGALGGAWSSWPHRDAQLRGLVAPAGTAGRSPE